MTTTPTDPCGSTMAELIELLWIENIAGFKERVLAGRALSSEATFTLGEKRFLATFSRNEWHGEDRPDRLFELTPNGSRRALDGHEILWSVFSTLPGTDLSVIDRTMRQLEESTGNIALLRGAGPAISESIQQTPPAESDVLWERLAAWRDRPFHPLSHERGGWSAEDIQAYGAETGQYFALCWCAVSRRLTLHSPVPDNGGPEEFILDDGQRQLLAQETASRNISPDTHLLLPVHPWHMKNALSKTYGKEIEDKDIVPLDFRGPLVCATSSLRTVALAGNPRRHVKLPLEIVTLGVRRLMSAQSLHNSLRGASLLRQARLNKPDIAPSFAITDESRFWTFSETERDLFAPRTASLGCAIRDFPAGPAGPHLIPLASFAVRTDDGLPVALRALLKERGNSDIGKLVRDLFTLLVTFAIRALGYGFIPEMHGQNTLVECHAGQPLRVILRDHDTVRCLPAWLHDAGLSAPDYLIKDPNRATMLLKEPEALFAYAQTLLFDVALRAIAEALHRSGAVEIAATRNMLRDITATAIARAQVSQEKRDLLRSAFIGSGEWPFKQVLTPLIHTAELGLGMPSAIGRTRNPLRDRDGK